MHAPFEMTEEEQDSTTSHHQLNMFKRLVKFVNDRLSEIEALEAKVENLENTKPNSND